MKMKDFQAEYNKLFRECIKFQKIVKQSLEKQNEVKHEKEALVVKLDEANELVEN